MWQMHDVGAGWWVLMTIGMIAFWALVIWGVVTLVRGLPSDRRGDRGAAPGQTPMEILGGRLARGEISPEEYQRLRDALRDDAPRPDPATLGG